MNLGGAGGAELALSELIAFVDPAAGMTLLARLNPLIGAFLAKIIKMRKITYNV